MDATGTQTSLTGPHPRGALPRAGHVHVLLALCLAALALGPIRESAAPWEAAPRLTFDDLSSEQIRIARWGAALFDEAGLDLPPVDFVRHPGTAACQGRAGSASYAGGRGRVGICTSSAGRLEEFLFLHELAHAWDRHSLPDERRRAFLDLRGLASWRSSDVDWEMRGSEQAAEIMVWGLIDRPVWIVRIPDQSCAELHAGYVTLTGQEPLHGYTDLCG